MLTACYAIYVFVLTLINPKLAPPLPPEARTLGAGVTSLLVMIGLSVLVGIAATLLFKPLVDQAPEVYGSSVAVIFALCVAIANKKYNLKVLSYLAERVIMVLVPPLALIFLVLGTIFIGLATPTEGGAMGAVGALVLAALNGRLTFTLTRQACESTLKLSAFVIFILIGARVFALTFYGINGHIWVKELMLSLPGGAVGFIVFTNVVVFILGCFIDFFEIAFILMPLLVAPATALGIDIVWFGVLMAMNMQTSFLTPPFGFALFYLRSVAPRLAYDDKVTGKRIAGVKTTTLYKGVVPFILIQIGMVFVVYFWPDLVLHYRDTIVTVDPSEVQKQLDGIQIPGLGGPGDMPPPRF